MRAVSAKALNILLLSMLLRFQRDNHLHETTQGVATLYPGLRAGCPFGALLLIFVHQTVHHKNLHKPDFVNALQSYHLTR